MLCLCPMQPATDASVCHLQNAEVSRVSATLVKLQTNEDGLRATNECLRTYSTQLQGQIRSLQLDTTVLSGVNNTALHLLHE